MENGDEGATYVGIFIGKSDFKRFSLLYSYPSMTVNDRCGARAD